MRRNWTEEELRLVINLYHKLPFGQMHRGNAWVVRLAKVLDRTASAVSMKLTNFASFDPELQARGVRGLQNAGKLDRQVWDQFYANLQDSIYESEQALQAYDLAYPLEPEAEQPFTQFEGEEKEVFRKARIGQAFFRNSLLAAYENTCCITGIQHPELLIASHIVPWATDTNQRLNPRNGLILNALHDKAFDRGLLTITPEYRIKVSAELLAKEQNDGTSFFSSYDGREIRLPNKLLPSRDFLAEHNRTRFRGAE